MALKTQLYRPDTCTCTLSQTWEFATDPPTFVSGAVEVRGVEHPTQTYDEIVTENRIKNYAIKALLTAMAAQNINPLDIRFRFDANRVCYVKVPNGLVLTVAQKQAVKTEFQAVLAEVNIAAANVDRVVLE